MSRKIICDLCQEETAKDFSVLKTEENVFYQGRKYIVEIKVRAEETDADICKKCAITIVSKI